MFALAIALKVNAQSASCVHCQCGPCGPAVMLTNNGGEAQVACNNNSQKCFVFTYTSDGTRLSHLTELEMGSSGKLELLDKDGSVYRTIHFGNYRGYEERNGTTTINLSGVR